MKQNDTCFESVAIVLPSLNPDHRFKAVVDGLVEADFRHIVIVADGSDEEHRHWFDEVRDYPACHVLVHEVNKGKGRALKDAFSYVYEELPELKGVVTIDGDGQHLLGDIIACGERMLTDGNKVVMGCRDFSHPDVPPRSVAGNRFTAAMFRLCYGIRITDTQTGLRGFPRKIFPELITLPGERYEYEMNMIFYFKEHLIPFTEVPIQVIYIENNASSHFNPIVDSIKIYAIFFKFVISSFGSAVLDLVLFRILSKYVFESIFPSNYIEISTAAARICSGIFNFSFNRSIFKSRSKVQKSGARYLVLWLVQMTLSAYIVKFLTAVTGITPLLVKIVTDTILFFISYKIQQLWVFKPERT